MYTLTIKRMIKSPTCGVVPSTKTIEFSHPDFTLKSIKRVAGHMFHGVDVTEVTVKKGVYFALVLIKLENRCYAFR